MRPRSETTIHCVASCCGFALIAVGGLLFPRPRGDQIDAGLERADRVEHGEVGRHVLVELGGDVHRPAPDLDAVLGSRSRSARDESIGLRKSSRLTRCEQVAVADAIDVDRDFRRVDRDQRRALLPLARQHIGLAGEMRLRRAVAHIDLVIGRFRVACSPTAEGRPSRKHDRVTLAVLEAFDAELLVLVRDGGVRRAGDRDIGREIGLARQRVGEVEADARLGRFVVDLVVDNAEAVLLPHGLVGLPDVG